MRRIFCRPVLTFPSKMDKIIKAVTKRAWYLAFREGGTVEASRRRCQAAVSEPSGDELDALPALTVFEISREG